jgi:hypothetical protein
MVLHKYKLYLSGNFLLIKQNVTVLQRYMRAAQDIP